VVAAHDARSLARLRDRSIWAGVALGSALVLALARWLTPDPRGLGTHLQLGLPPCGFFALTSLPCPACGLTTAFAHMARLELTLAVRAHPLGVPLFMCTALAVPLSSALCVRAISVRSAIERLRPAPLLAMMAVSALLAWIARLLANLIG
jgi:uncharacterized protein DUF2752